MYTNPLNSSPVQLKPPAGYRCYLRYHWIPSFKLLDIYSNWNVHNVDWRAPETNQTSNVTQNNTEYSKVIDDGAAISGIYGVAANGISWRVSA